DKIILESAMLSNEKDKLSHTLMKVTKEAARSDLAIQRLNSGRASLEDALSMGQTSRVGLGYVSKDQSLSQKHEENKTLRTVGSKTNRCNYCLKEGHLAHNCFKLTRHIIRKKVQCDNTKSQTQESQCDHTRPQMKVWRPKTTIVCHMSTVSYA